jgi:hypothetical protein
MLANSNHKAKKFKPDKYRNLYLYPTVDSRMLDSFTCFINIGWSHLICQWLSEHQSEKNALMHRS